VYQLAQEKLKGIEADIEALRLTGRYVRKVLADWEQQIQSAGPGQQSHLLYSLGDAVKKAGAPVDRFRRKKDSENTIHTSSIQRAALGGARHAVLPHA